MTEPYVQVVAGTEGPAPSLPPRRRWLRRTGILLINTILVAIIAGLLVATWLPAYVYHHPEVKIGASQAK